MKRLFGGRAWSRRGLLARILVLTTLGMLPPVAILAWFTWASYDRLGTELMIERQLFGKSVASHLEYVIRSDLATLQTISSATHVTFEDRDAGLEPGAVRQAYLHSHFLDRVVLLGEDGRVLWEEPQRARAVPLPNLAQLADVFRTGRPYVSGLVEVQPGTRRLYALVPLQNWQGKVVRVVVGEMNPDSARFAALLEPFRPGQRGSTDLMDEQGRVIATTDPSRLYRLSDHGHFIGDLIRDRRPAAGTCHGCHERALVRGRVREVMAFVPLSVVPWGIAVRQPEDEAFAAIIALRSRLFVLGPAVLAVAVLFAWGAARSIRRPVTLLTAAAERIAAGHMDEPIPTVGDDEVGRLGRSLERMRVTLKDSLDTIAGAKQELEVRVEERTRELEALYRQLREREAWRGQLLRKVISAQEDERRRIARELHDETSQSLAALVMEMDASLSMLPAGLPHDRLVGARAVAVRALDELHRLLFDLRPSVLDDLGLVSAIRWCAEHHLEPLGIAVRCEFSELDQRFPPEVETALFRVVQEAVTNIAKHAEAETVLIQCTLRDGVVTIEIEDDGKGFEVQRAAVPNPKGAGLGLLGIRERVELLGGTVEIESSPGQGTRVVVRAPVDDGRADG